MRSKKLIFCMALPALLMGTAAQGTMWMTDFSTMTGTNGAAYTPYNGNYWDTWASPVPDSPTWLSKKDDPAAVGGATALFAHGPGGNSARMRHQTNLPGSMNLDDGISVAYQLKMSERYLNRGPIQVQGTRTGATGDLHSAYIRLRTQVSEGWMGGQSFDFVDIMRNDGASYHYGIAADDPRHIRGGTLGTSIDTMTVLSGPALNLTDQWAQWTVAAKFNPYDTTEVGGIPRAWTYWKVWLDGQLLQWHGPSGGHNLDWSDNGYCCGEGWSFRTMTDGSGGGRIALGELGHNTHWNFEFDFVNYRDDGYMCHWVPEPTSLLLLASGVVFLRRRRS